MGSAPFLLILILSAAAVHGLPAEEKERENVNS